MGRIVGLGAGMHAPTKCVPGCNSPSPVPFLCRRAHYNAFSGSLPESWANPDAFPYLDYFDVYANQLTGPLPDSWGSPGALPKLRTLYINGNQISGTLPASWGEEGALPQLTKM